MHQRIKRQKIILQVGLGDKSRECEPEKMTEAKDFSVFAHKKQKILSLMELFSDQRALTRLDKLSHKKG